MEAYEKILDTISNMTLVMERCPSVFANIDEESLRQHLLVPLNGLYEGKATGETFNRAGKTDILIRENDKNVFIAECKFWKGEKKFTEAIDQLLSYSTWRDAKAAIIVFNKNKDTSAVLKKIPEVARTHKSFRGELAVPQQGRLRFTLHHPNDTGSCIIVTVLILDIPDENTA
jgi:hypothetical protein